MNDATHAAVLDRVFDPLAGCLTPEVAQRIASLRASEDVQQRIDELADKSSQGTLTAAERAEYETWVRAINFVGLLQAKARKAISAAGMK